MSEQNPYEKLGVTEDASFDEIQDAKGRLIQQHHGDQKLVESVEAAYDAIIMDRLRMRQEGKIKVPERIRFPEKLSPPPSFTQTTANRSPAWLQRLIDTPTPGELIWPTGSFAVLTAVTAFYQSPDASILPFMLALGVGCNVFFLNRKEQKLGRSVLLTLAGLLVGIGLGTMLAGFLIPQLATIGLTIEKFAALVTFLLLWLISSFLR